MSLGRLATHIAQIPKWISRIVTIDDYDFMKQPFSAHVAASTEELLGIPDNSVNTAIDDFGKMSIEDFDKHWVVRMGENVIYDIPKKVAFRG
ncbi:MAG: hypothetical protein C4308_12580 [Chitinophagaceae bacterium]